LNADLLEALAEGSGLDDLSVTELATLLVRCAAVQTRIAARLAMSRGDDKPIASNDHLLEAQAAAIRLGVSPTWVYRHARQLPFTIRVGGLLRFSAAGIEKFVRSRLGRAQGFKDPQETCRPRKVPR